MKKANFLRANPPTHPCNRESVTFQTTNLLAPTHIYTVALNAVTVD
jgi:hypothetical protein